MFLLDTDILIYSLKGHPRIVSNLKKHLDSPKSVSVISYGELVYGACKSQYVTENLAKIYRLREIFPIIEVTPAVTECFGRLKADLSKEGLTVADFDLLIGATAITWGLTLVSNNQRHFEKIPGLKLINWVS